MNRKIQKRLLAAGHALASEEPPEKPFFAWFAEDVLGLDSEDYRRALAHERRRQGRRATTNPRPSLNAIRALYARARAAEILAEGGPSEKFDYAEERLRCGGRLDDLQCGWMCRERASAEPHLCTKSPFYSHPGIKFLLRFYILPFSQ